MINDPFLFSRIAFVQAHAQPTQLPGAMFLLYPREQEERSYELFEGEKNLCDHNSFLCLYHLDAASAVPSSCLTRECPSPLQCRETREPLPLSPLLCRWSLLDNQAIEGTILPRREDTTLRLLPRQTRYA